MESIDFSVLIRPNPSNAVPGRRIYVHEQTSELSQARLSILIRPPSTSVLCNLTARAE